MGAHLQEKSRRANRKTTPVREGGDGTPSGQSSIYGPAARNLNEDLEGFDMDPEARHKLELKLLHYFCYVIGPTFLSTVSPQARGIWNCDGVSVAIDNPCLLNAIFSIAALHAATESQESAPAIFVEDKDFADRVHSRFHGHHKKYRPERYVEEKEVDYAEAHRFYFNRAVQEQRRALYVLDERNADAICLTSILLCQTVVRLEPAPHDDETVKPYSPPVQWLLMGNAIRVVVNSTKHFLTPHDVFTQISKYPAGNFDNDGWIMRSSFIVPFNSLLDFPSSEDDESLDPDVMNVYHKTLAYVGGVCLSVERRDPAREVARSIQAFAPIVPKVFVDYLDEKRPRALVIFAHLMVNAKYVEDFWWYRGTADRDVLGVDSVLPQEWRWAMKWPLRRLQELTDEREAEQACS